MGPVGDFLDMGNWGSWRIIPGLVVKGHLEGVLQPDP